MSEWVVEIGSLIMFAGAFIVFSVLAIGIPWAVAQMNRSDESKSDQNNDRDYAVGALQNSGLEEHVIEIMAKRLAKTKPQGVSIEDHVADFLKAYKKRLVDELTDVSLDNMKPFGLTPSKMLQSRPEDDVDGDSHLADVTNVGGIRRTT